MYSGKPAASILVTDIVAKHELDQPQGRSKLNDAGMQAVELTAQKIAATVDELLGKVWDRRAGEFVELKVMPNPPEPVIATCSCGSGIPVQMVEIEGQTVTLVALPLIFEQLYQTGKLPCVETYRELLETVRIYNPVPAGEEPAYAAVLDREYYAYCERQQVTSMSRTATYNTTVSWMGEHWGRLVMGNGPEMDFSAPPDAQGHSGVLTPEDAFVAAANSCIMMMFLWAAERYKLDLLSYQCRAEGQSWSSWTAPRSSPICAFGRSFRSALAKRTRLLWKPGHSVPCSLLRSTAWLPTRSSLRSSLIQTSLF